MDDQPEPDKKQCLRCRRYRPLTPDFFGKHSGNWRSWCRECVNAAQRARTTKPGANLTRWPSVAAFDIEDPIVVGENLPETAVPLGFEVATLTTEVDAAGATTKQHIGARRERTADAPVIAPVQPGTSLKRLSTLTGGDGKVIQQWQIYTKEDEEREKREQWLLDAIREFPAAWEDRRPTPLDERTDDRLMCVVPMGDPHFGQFSWALETGDDYDLKLAQQYHRVAVEELIRSAPAAKRGKLISLGDFVHADNSDNRTLRGNHQLDVDTRWPKVIRASVHSIIELAELMLRKFEEVEAWVVPGNHDPHSTVMLQLGLQLYFRNEPRIHVNPTAGLFFYERFGKSLIGSTHTHTIKDRASLGETMAVHQPVEWGKSLYRYWYCGHVHHDSLLETKGGVIVETMRTLAGKDKFAAENAYLSGRDMKLDVFDLEDGRVQRNTVGIRQIQRRLGAQSPGEIIAANSRPPD